MLPLIYLKGSEIVIDYEGIKRHQEWLATRPMDEAFGLLMDFNDHISDDYGIPYEIEDD